MECVGSVIIILGSEEEAEAKNKEKMKNKEESSKSSEEETLQLDAADSGWLCYCHVKLWT